MTEYIKQVKKQFVSVYHFQPARMEGDEPVFSPGQIPDGDYPMTIGGKRDSVKLVNGRFSCCNFPPK